ncbi:MAG: EamA family transporter [Methylophilaceae bacterium]
MSHLALLVWLLNVIVDTTGHVALKRAAISEHENEWQRWKIMLSSVPLWVGIVCFVMEFVLWLVLLSILPLSLGVLLSAFNTVAIMLAGRIIFKELLDPFRIVGITLITVGVALAGGYA